MDKHNFVFLSDSFLLFTLYIYCVGDVIRFRQAFQRETIGGLGPGWLQYATTIPVEKNGKTKDNCQRIEKCSFLFTVTDELVRFFGPPKKAIVIQSRDTTVSRKKNCLDLNARFLFTIDGYRYRVERTDRRETFEQTQKQFSWYYSHQTATWKRMAGIFFSGLSTRFLIFV